MHLKNIRPGFDDLSILWGTLSADGKESDAVSAENTTNNVCGSLLFLSLPEEIFSLIFTTYLGIEETENDNLKHCTSTPSTTGTVRSW